MSLPKIIGIIAGIIGALAVIFATAKGIAKLEERVSNLGKTVQVSSDKLNELGEKVSDLGNRMQALEPRVDKKGLKTEAPPSPVIADEIEIPLDAGWKSQGNIEFGGGYKEGTLELKAKLKGGNDFAEWFLDLRYVDISGIERNPDRSYNLAGKELIAFVISDEDFKGKPSHPNGAQFVLKDRNWKNLEGPWINVTDEMRSPGGMRVFFRIPDEQISRNVAGISLKFTINSESKATYQGSFFIRSVRITR